MIKIIRSDDAEKLEELIAKGQNVNEADKKGYTPLMYAAEWGASECVPKLLDAGAKLDQKDTINGRNALIIATMQSNAECVDALLSRDSSGSHVNTQDNEGLSALHWAVKLEEEDMVINLTSKGKSNLELVDKTGEKVVHYAAATGNANILKVGIHPFLPTQ